MRAVTDKSLPRAPGTGEDVAVPATIAGDAEFWRVIRGMQALRSNEGTTSVEVFHLIAEMIEAAAVVALRETEATFEQLIVEILKMVGEDVMARLYVEDRSEYRRVYEAGARRYSSGQELPEVDPLLPILTDPARSDTEVQTAILCDAQRRRESGLLHPSAAFYAIGYMVSKMAAVRFEAECGTHPADLDDADGESAAAHVAAQVAGEFGEEEMADLIENDWPEFKHRYAEGRAAFDAATPRVAVQ